MSERTCTIEDCTSPVIARGWCEAHYRRWRKRGTTDLAHPPLVERFWRKVNKNGPVPEYRPDLGPCWLWTAGMARGGYGKFTVTKNGKKTHPVAHRVSYEWLVGSVPEDLQLDHLCRVRHCVNPRHLEPVTGRENVIRGIGFAAVNAVKTHCPAGHEYTPTNMRQAGRRRVCVECSRQASREYYQRNPKPRKPRAVRRGSENINARLTEAAVLKIRELYAAGGISQERLAGEFGVSSSLVSVVVRREAWTHI